MMAKKANRKATSKKTTGHATRTTKKSSTPKGKTKTITLSIYRYDSSKEEDPHYQNFPLKAKEHDTLLDALVHIKDKMDGSVTFRRNCKNAICGSCVVRVNGQAVLACKEHVIELDGRYDGKLKIEPMGNMPIIKDLVTDMKPFWDQYNAIEPWLIRKNEAPKMEHIVDPKDRDKLVQMADCIQCGACYSDCNTVQIEPRFIGPAALAKAWRYVADARDEGDKERLKLYEKEHGHWDCTHCFYCIEVCPMDVAPMDQILKLRKVAMDAGHKSVGQRHHDAFVDSVRTSGWLNEFSLPLKSKGFDIIGQMQLVPIGLRMVMHGKMPHIHHKQIEKANEVKNIVGRTKSVDVEGGA